MLLKPNWPQNKWASLALFNPTKSDSQAGDIVNSMAEVMKADGLY